MVLPWIRVWVGAGWQAPSSRIRESSRVRVSAGAKGNFISHSRGSHRRGGSLANGCGVGEWPWAGRPQIIKRDGDVINPLWAPGRDKRSDRALRLAKKRSSFGDI
ncbi:hypothetical protein KAM329D_09130 [Aeromonas caviae]|nr:hypothetical protein KAM329_029700 [Aeromonas caviae]GJC21932.1 hypothetical protein KAM329D_09130 [Aeromonas caviae]